MKYMHLISRERDPWKVEGRYKQNLRSCLLLPSRALFGTGRGNSEVCIVLIFLNTIVKKKHILSPEMTLLYNFMLKKSCSKFQNLQLKFSD